MGNFIVGIVVGIIIATVGVQSLATSVGKLLDKGVDTVKVQSKELAK
jgi:divalent metal cation (Fe/Co/Zn/Cd) transporter